MRVGEVRRVCRFACVLCAAYNEGEAAPNEDAEAVQSRRATWLRKPGCP
jgi:hypothetical protein